jgi:hypothetical protein
MNVEQIKHWAVKYNVGYDEYYYDPWIFKARAGDINSLLQITCWKNVGNSCPMNLSKKKRNSFDFFISNLDSYLKPNGRDLLRRDFEKRAPVYSIFWCHVLYEDPIFDVHTNRAFHYFAKNKVHLKERNAAIKAGNHWKLYDEYCAWFMNVLRNVQSADSLITARDLDRALFEWGKKNKASLTNP